MEIEKLEADILKQATLFHKHREAVLSAADHVRKLAGGNPTLITGIATSFWGADSAISLLNTQKFGGAELINTCDLLDYYYPQNLDDRPIVIVSRSGESAETMRLLDMLAPERVVLAITEGRESRLAKRANATLLFNADEQAFPNTVSFTLTQLLSLSVAIGLGYLPTKSLDMLIEELIQVTKEIVSDSESAKNVADAMNNDNTIILEGQGHLSGVVNQYGLDCHEIRIAGIPVTGGIMRHGVIELTQNCDTMTLLLIPDDASSARKIHLAEELKAAGKPVAVVTDTSLKIDSSIPTLRFKKTSIDIESIAFTIAMQEVYLNFVKAKGLKKLQPSLVGKVTREE